MSAGIIPYCKGAPVISGPDFKFVLPLKVGIILSQLTHRPTSHANQLDAHFKRNGAIAHTLHDILLT